jgi:hypothetical protein
MTLSEAFWTVFEMTGSVVAYLLYCHYLRAENGNRHRLVQ